jgi:MSHA biogenesis protein MshL
VSGASTTLRTISSTGASQSLAAASSSPIDIAGGTPTQGTSSAATSTVTPGALGSVVAAALGKGFFGLAFQTANFATLLNFLETQGSVSVLSSPRIATLNNQKAVLKVGTDDFFVTSISTTSTPVGNTTSTTPSIGVTPFFSGISLDVTPSINDQGSITLHVHPAVSNVTERNKVLNLGTLGTYTLPLASSDINESDAVVRAQDGHIIAIGGLMSQEQNETRAPAGTSDLPVVGNLFGNRNRSYAKRELVILVKPTVIKTEQDWPRTSNSPVNHVELLASGHQRILRP